MVIDDFLSMTTFHRSNSLKIKDTLIIGQHLSMLSNLIRNTITPLPCPHQASGLPEALSALTQCRYEGTSEQTEPPALELGHEGEKPVSTYICICTSYTYTHIYMCIHPIKLYPHLCCDKHLTSRVNNTPY